MTSLDDTQQTNAGAIDAPASPASPEPAPEAPLFDAVIRQHRSLSRNGFFWVMAVLGGVAAVMGTVFLSMGAWPIFGLYGIDILLVYLAFKSSYRSADAHWEEVLLTREKLVVSRYGPKPGMVKRYGFQPAWVRVEIDDPVRDDSDLALVSHGKRFVFARFLSPDERLDLGKALTAALDVARSPQQPGGTDAREMVG